MAGLLSRAELPTWVAPLPETASRFCIYFADNVRSLREYQFRNDRTGIAFLDVFRHEWGNWTSACTRAADIYFIPPEVLIAAGVEAMRRRRP